MISNADEPLDLRQAANLSLYSSAAVPHSLQSLQYRVADLLHVTRMYEIINRIRDTHFPDVGSGSGSGTRFFDAGVRELPSTAAGYGVLKPQPAHRVLDRSAVTGCGGLEPPPAHRVLGRSVAIGSDVMEPPPAHRVHRPPLMPVVTNPLSGCLTTVAQAPKIGQGSSLDLALHSINANAIVDSECTQQNRDCQLTSGQRTTNADREIHTTIITNTNAAITAGHATSLKPATATPPQVDSFVKLLKQYPIMWQGLLLLKNNLTAVHMHFLFGNPLVAEGSLPHNSDGSTPLLSIVQCMPLEKMELESVAQKMQSTEYCIMLALSCGHSYLDVLQQFTNMQTNFNLYLQRKQAAGIINILMLGNDTAAYVMHVFPSCEFANENLGRIAPKLLHHVADIAHLFIVIVRVLTQHPNI